MTMPNPVAEAVALLRRDAYAPHFTSVGAANLMIEAADLLERQQAEIERLSRETSVADQQNARLHDELEVATARIGNLEAQIERLSRERDTGVPEELLNTVAEWAKWARTWSGSAFLSGDPVENDEENRGALYTDLCKLGNHMIWLEDELLKLRSAAPQPPAVSPDIVALNQAREALAFYANPDNWNEDGQCFAGRVPVPMWASDDHGDTFIDGHLDLGATARSVLHHEKEADNG